MKILKPHFDGKALVTVALAIWAVRAFGADVENGDLFVGSASVVDGFGNTAGGIWRIRGNTPTLFCASPASSFDPGFWNVPNDVIVDSQGRIAFIAPINGQNWGLLRCATLGAPAERLALLHVTDNVPTGWPDPFPNLRFGVPGYSGFVTSLHILKQRVITDDFQSNPQVHNADAYEFVAVEEGTNPTPTELFRYDTEMQTWKHGADLPGTPNMSSVVAHDDGLYMLLRTDVLRRTSLPLEIGLSGKVNGVAFKLSLGLFGGVHEVSGAAMDDTTVPNVSSGCNTDPPGKHDDVTDEMPYNNGFIPLSADRLCYDEHGGFGLVIKSGYGPYPGPYLTQISSFLLNDDPMDDVQGYFHQAYDNCRHVPWIQFAPILPYISQDGTFGNAANVIATAPGGMVGSQFYEDRVIRLTPGDKATVITTLYHPQGIAAYPAIVPSLGTVVYLTINSSPVDVLVTDAAGKRLGIDPTTGDPVNDFGANGFDSGAGEPRVFAIKNPAPGEFHIDAIGTGNGSYTIDISAADLASGVSSRIRTLGTVSTGDRFKPGFTLDAQSALTFVLRALSCSRNGADITVAFEAVAGQTYRLERKLNLADASWQSISSVNDLTAANSGTAQITDPGASSFDEAFYRIHLLP